MGEVSTSIDDLLKRAQEKGEEKRKESWYFEKCVPFLEKYGAKIKYFFPEFFEEMATNLGDYITYYTFKDLKNDIKCILFTATLTSSGLLAYVGGSYLLSDRIYSIEQAKEMLQEEAEILGVDHEKISVEIKSIWHIRAGEVDYNSGINTYDIRLYHPLRSILRHELYHIYNKDQINYMKEKPGLKRTLRRLKGELKAGLYQFRLIKAKQAPQPNNHVSHQ